MIFSNEQQMMTLSPEEFGQLHREYIAFQEELGPKMLAGEGLEPSLTATTVRVRDGRTLTTDGPFAETKELIGGFFLIEAADLDEAVAWAAKIPSARLGAIEV